MKNTIDELQTAIDDAQKVYDHAVNNFFMLDKKGLNFKDLSFIHILSFIFILLKLGNIISWSWWFVLMPVYIPLGLTFILFFMIKFSKQLLKTLSDSY